MSYVELHSHISPEGNKESIGLHLYQNHGVSRFLIEKWDTTCEEESNGIDGIGKTLFEIGLDRDTLVRIQRAIDQVLADMELQQWREKANHALRSQK